MTVKKIENTVKNIPEYVIENTIRNILKNTVQGVVFTPKKIIPTLGGPVLHIIRSDSETFAGFAEIYASEVEPSAIKAWKRHKKMTQNFAVVNGQVLFILYDDRPDSISFGKLTAYILGRPDDYGLLTVPPMLWYGFAGLGNAASVIVNCTNLVHDPLESEKLDICDSYIPFAWAKVDFSS